MFVVGRRAPAELSIHGRVRKRRKTRASEIIRARRIDLGLSEQVVADHSGLSLYEYGDVMGVEEMAFKWVLVAFAAQGSPPRAEEVNARNPAYRFSPLFDIGAIYSADMALWSPRTQWGDGGSQVFCPGFSRIAKGLMLAVENDGYFILAATRLPEYFSPGSSDEALSLVPVSRVTEAFEAANLVVAGFDVLDPLTGISALADMGYGQTDCDRLAALQLTANEFGLLKNQDDAERFVDFASMAAPEHAPFLPVKVLVRFPQGRPPSPVE